MSKIWSTGFFKDLSEAQEWYSTGARSFDVTNDRRFWELISKEKEIFKSFLGENKPTAVNFFYTDTENQTMFDSSEFFLIVEKQSLLLIQGLWNFDKDFTLDLAESVVFANFDKVDTRTKPEDFFPKKLKKTLLEFHKIANILGAKVEKITKHDNYFFAMSYKIDTRRYNFTIFNDDNPDQGSEFTVSFSVHTQNSKYVLDMKELKEKIKETVSITKAVDRLGLLDLNSFNNILEEVFKPFFRSPKPTKLATKKGFSVHKC